MISEFNRFFKSKSLASTYKPTLAKCLLDLADYKPDEGSQWVQKNGDTYTVDLHFVAARFLRYYHPLRFKFKLKQEATKKRIAIYNILEEHQEELGTKSTPSKKLMCSEKFKEMREKTIINGAIKQQVLPKLRKDCNIYTIDKGSKSIKVKKEIVDFMRDNKKLLEAALNHMIAEYLEKCNSSPNISTKLEEKIARTTLKKDKFQKIIDMQSSCCFYCGNKGDSFAQEHFLPWNFLFQTENYNIIAACQACNSSKNDRLPHGKYLEKIILRNKKLEDLPMGYSEEFMRNMYENCRLEYHGSDQKLWEQ
jgi:5-methylcytosine-specific restriction endonuclease McrA